jgi:protein phosphatase 4 regulatory subunit 3
MEEGSQAKDPRVIVESEEQPDRILLETKICKEDMFSKQQGA